MTGIQFRIANLPIADMKFEILKDNYRLPRDN